MTILTRESILGADDLPTEEFDAPEWGGTLMIRALNGAQREEIEVRVNRAKATSEGHGWKGLKALVASYVIVGEDGKPLFTSKDFAAISEKSGAMLDRLFEHVMEVNGLTQKEEKSIEGN